MMTKKNVQKISVIYFDYEICLMFHKEILHLKDFTTQTQKEFTMQLPIWSLY